MAATYTLLASSSPSGVSSVTFSSIPQTYDTLVVRASIRAASATNTWETIWVTTNIGSSQSQTQLKTNGSTASNASTRSTGRAYWEFLSSNGNGSTASTFSNFELVIPDYCASTLYGRQLLMRSSMESYGAANAYIDHQAWFLNNNTAISSITFADQTVANYASGTVFYLYGIKNS